MSKSVLKRTLSVMLVLSLLVLLPASANASVVSPGALLKLGESGSLYAYVRVLTSPPETAVAFVTVEREVGGQWEYVDSWSAVGYGTLVTTKDLWPSKGYKYRIMVTGSTVSFPSFSIESNHFRY